MCAPNPSDPRDPRSMAAIPVVFVLTAALLVAMGRPPLGPDGRFEFWNGDIWSAGNSQRLADAYSFSHLCHGILFYGLLHAAARGLSLPRRLLIAVVIEASWEILENSPIIIDRYRAGTIAQGYAGDSVLNSMSDIGMMTLGFLFASRVKVRHSIAAFLAMEIGCLFWVRDNLTLNVIMLIHPVEAIKAWQMGGRTPLG